MVANDPILTISGVVVSGLDEASITAHSADWDLTEGSLAFSVTPDKAGGFQGLVSKDAKYFGTGGHLGVWIDRGQIYVRLQSEEASYVLRGGTVTAGETLDVGVSFGSERMLLYVDGVEVARDSYTGGLIGNQEPIVVGASQWGSAAQSADALTHKFKGEISDLRLFDVQQDGADFDAAFAAPPPDTPINEAPFVAVPEAGQVVREGESASIDVAHFFRDPDGDALSYTLRNAPDFVTMDGTVVTIAPGFEDDGLYEVEVIASDGALSSGPASITYEVVNAAPPPDPISNETVHTFEAEDFDATQGVGVFSQGGNQQIGATRNGEWVRYDAVDFGTDPDATQEIDLKLSSGSQGGTLEIRTGAPDGTLLTSYTTGNTGGWASYDVVTLDLGPLTGEQDLYFVFRGNARSIMDIDTFVVTTTSAQSDPVNTAPELWRPFFSELNLNEGDTIGYSIPAVFRDVDGDPLTYSITSGPDFMFIDGIALRFAPQDGDDGIYTGAVVASDGDLTSDPWAFTINVRDTVSDTPNLAPVVEQSNVVETVFEGDTITVDVAAFFSDPEGDALSYSLENAFDFVSLSGADLTVAPGFDDAGTYEVRVLANDGELSSPASNLILRVRDAVPTPPSEVSLTATATSLTADGAGAYRWDDAVTVTGYLRSGDLGEVVFDTQFSDHGFGVPGPGSRWDGQIDFYDVNGGESEKIVLDFDVAVTDVTLHVGMLGANEGAGETGVWITYDETGNPVASGLIGAELSALGPDVKQPGSYGEYPIEITSPDFWRLEIAATQFGHGTGTSQQRNYGENSSDFNIQGVDFTVVDGFML
ncbi:MAG: carbohydrate-binding protein [Pseudomonadota bacterium]